jgi:hypothetical protein
LFGFAITGWRGRHHRDLKQRNIFPPSRMKTTMKNHTKKLATPAVAFSLMAVLMQGAYAGNKTIDDKIEALQQQSGSARRLVPARRRRSV